MAPKKSTFLCFLIPRVLESRIKLETSNNIAYKGKCELKDGIRRAPPPVVAMVTFTLTEEVGITVAGEKEQLAPMGRFAHANAKL